MTTKILNIIMLTTAAITLAGCEHKSILVPGGEPRDISVLFMWDEAPDAPPQGMTLYFFPMTRGGKIWRYDTPGRDGGKMELPVGKYSMLAYNNDLPGITVSGLASMDDAMASLRLSQGAASGSGPLYCAVVDCLEVTPCGVEYSGGCESVHKVCPMGLVRSCPVRRFCTYSVVVKGVDGIGLVRKASVALSGMAADVRLAAGALSDSAVAVAMPLEKADTADLRGRSTAFGIAPGQEKISATISIVRTDGVALSKTYDVTRQVLQASDPRNVTVVIEGMEIPGPDTPPPSGSDVGIEVGVDGWQVIRIDLSTDY